MSSTKDSMKIVSNLLEILTKKKTMEKVLVKSLINESESLNDERGILSAADDISGKLIIIAKETDFSNEESRSIAFKKAATLFGEHDGLLSELNEEDRYKMIGRIVTNALLTFLNQSEE